jgi:hypothetical protein
VENEKTSKTFLCAVTQFSFKNTKIENESMEQGIPCKRKTKKAAVHLLTSDIIDFKSKIDIIDFKLKKQNT